MESKQHTQEYTIEYAIMSCHVECAIPPLEGLDYRTGVQQEAPHIHNPLQSPWKPPVYEEKQGDGKKGRVRRGSLRSLPDSGQPLRQR